MLASWGSLLPSPRAPFLSLMKPERKGQEKFRGVGARRVPAGGSKVESPLQHPRSWHPRSSACDWRATGHRSSVSPSPLLPSCSLHEEDAQRRETYHRQGRCQALVQRSPWLVMRMGILGRGLQEYQLPYQRMLPLPIFTPAKVGSTKEEHEDTPIQLQELLALEAALGGQCVDRQDVAEITKQLPPVVPVSKPGALCRTLSRSTSQEAQRG